jgi:hypothetical protein
MSYEIFGKKHKSQVIRVKHRGVSLPQIIVSNLDHVTAEHMCKGKLQL